LSFNRAALSTHIAGRHTRKEDDAVAVPRPGADRRHQENLRLKQLADDGGYVSACIYTPTSIAGATGSMGSPVAID